MAKVPLDIYAAITLDIDIEHNHSKSASCQIWENYDCQLYINFYDGCQTPFQENIWIVGMLTT